MDKPDPTQGELIMVNPIDSWPDMYQGLVKPYMRTIWDILDFATDRMNELRRLDKLDSPEADTLGEIITFTTKVPNLIPRPQMAARITEVRIWVDDIREAPEGWMWCRTSGQAILNLAEHMTTSKVSELSLDHDLGGEDTTRPVVLWMCQNNMWPDKVSCHSMNTVGREWINGMVERYKT